MVDDVDVDFDADDDDDDDDNTAGTGYQIMGTSAIFGAGTVSLPSIHEVYQKNTGERE